MNRADVKSEKVVIEIDQFANNHNGGSIFFKEGLMYIFTGDGGGANDPRGNGQNKYDGRASCLLCIESFLENYCSCIGLIFIRMYDIYSKVWYLFEPLAVEHVGDVTSSSKMTQLYRVSINYRYNFQSLSKFYFLRYFHLICFVVKENASSFFLLNRYLCK